MNPLELAAIIADSVIALSTLAAVLWRGATLVEQLRQAREDIKGLREWKHDFASQQIQTLLADVAVHEQRLDEQQRTIGDLRRRAGAR